MIRFSAIIAIISAALWLAVDLTIAGIAPAVIHNETVKEISRPWRYHHGPCICYVGDRWLDFGRRGLDSTPARSYSSTEPFTLVLCTTDYSTASDCQRTLPGCQLEQAMPKNQWEQGQHDTLLYDGAPNCGHLVYGRNGWSAVAYDWRHPSCAGPATVT